MIDPANRNLSIVRQCRLLKVSRSGWYYEPKEESPFNLSLMRIIDEQFLATPYYGSRQMMRQLRRAGYQVSRKRVRRLMRLMGLQAIYQAPKTSLPHPEHKVYPYLLKDLTINRPNQAWCSDISAPSQAAWKMEVGLP
jgi:putative transposase